MLVNIYKLRYYLSSLFGRGCYKIWPNIAGKYLRKKYITLLDKTEYASEQEKLDYQISKLQQTCQYSYKYIPYYKKLFDQTGFNVDKLKYFDELEKIPFLTKEIVQDNIDDMVSILLPRNALNYVTTSGSTGTPLGIYRTWELVIKEHAYTYHMWKRVGYGLNSKLAVLRKMPTGKGGTYFKKAGKLYLSPYHLTDDNMSQYIDVLREFKPDYLHVYPSAVYILADFMRRYNIEPIHSIKAILAGSENVYPYQRKLIEEVFNCRLFGHYGHNELACVAGECEKSNDYHIHWQYGYTEILNENGKPVNQEGELGEIVATSFDNFAMPFIRYKTRDIAKNTLKTCLCGRNYKLISGIEGRMQELLITKSGHCVPVTGTSAIHSNLKDRLRQFQFFQDDPTYCIFYAVKQPNFTEADEKAIYRVLKEKYGEELEFRIKYVPEILPAVSGKRGCVIQKLPIRFNDNINND